MRIPVKGLLNGRGLGLGIDDEEVLLGVGRLSDVLCVFQRRFPTARSCLHTPIPASSKPVTES